MITNLEAKLSGLEPVTIEDIFELVSSWGRSLEFETSTHIIIEKCSPMECYPLENLDVSQIDNLSDLFLGSFYNGDLSNWDVSNCLNMDYMFFNSKFNNNSLKDWNVSKVNKMNSLFNASSFNGDISSWDISNVKDLAFIFQFSKFDGDISKWQFNKDVNCYSIFFRDKEFENKYNQGNEIPNKNKLDFFKWFEENREKIREINKESKEKVLDFFSFDNSLEIK